jgi:hypothetical protein
MPPPAPERAEKVPSRPMRVHKQQVATPHFFLIIQAIYETIRKCASKTERKIALLTPFRLSIA